MSAASRNWLMVWGLIIVSVLTSGVWGQGLLGRMSEPMSARGVGELLRPLHLSAQQQQAVDEFHTEYMASFRALREGEIKDFLEDAATRLRGFRAIFDRPAAERALKQLQRITSRIEMVEEGFFDQIQTVFSEEQIERLPRVRQVRERRRLSGGLSGITNRQNRAARIDLSGEIGRLDLPPEAREAIDPALMSYEMRLTGLARTLHRNTSAMILEVIKELERRGYNAETMNDSTRRGEMMEQLRTVWGEVNQGLLKDTAKIASLNRRTVDELAPLLPKEQGRKLRWEFYRRGYTEIARDRLEARTLLARLRERDDMSSEVREQVEAIGDDFYAALESLGGKMADIIDQQRLSGSGAWFNRGRRSEEGEEVRKRLEELRERRKKKDEVTVAMLKVMLGEDMLAGGEGEGSKARGEARAQIQTVVRGRGNGEPISLAPTGEPAKQKALDASGLPSPISRSRIIQFSHRHKLGEAQEAVLLSLFDDYGEGLEELRQAGPVHDYETTMGIRRELEANKEAASPQDLRRFERLPELRQAAEEEIFRVDGGFYEDIRLLLGQDLPPGAVLRLRLRREREVYRWQMRGRGLERGNRSRFSAIRSSDREDGVDLSQLVEGLDLSVLGEDRRTTFDDTVLHYEEVLTEHLKAAAGVAGQMGRAAAGSEVRSFRRSGGGGRAGQPGSGRRNNAGNRGGNNRRNREGRSNDDEGGALRRAVAAARQEIVELNRSTRDQLISILPEVGGGALARAYDRRAFPAVFADPGAMESRLGTALRMGDLTAQQRSSLTDLATEYRESYDELCVELIEFSRQESAASGGDFANRDWTAWREQRRAREEVRIRRDDLNVKTRNRVRGVLSEEQMERMGG